MDKTVAVPAGQLLGVFDQNGFQSPVTLLNLSTTETVYLSDNGGQAVGTGTPLGPGNTCRWSARRNLYISSGGAEASVGITDNAADVFPAGAVAQQLIAQGLPGAIAAAINLEGVTVDNELVTLFYQLMQAGTHVDNVDMGNYVSLVVEVFAVENNGDYKADVMLSELSGTASTQWSLGGYMHPNGTNGRLARGVLPSLSQLYSVYNNHNGLVIVIVRGSYVQLPAIKQVTTIRGTGTTAPSTQSTPGLWSNNDSTPPATTVVNPLTDVASRPMTFTTYKLAAMAAGVTLTYSVIIRDNTGARYTLYRKVWLDTDPNGSCQAVTIESPGAPVEIEISHTAAAALTTRWTLTQNSSDMLG